MNTQKCPCLRRGCLCNYDNQHPFQEALISPPTNTRIIEVLRKTIKDLEEHQEKRKMYEWRLKNEIMNIRQTKTTQGKQLSIKVKVGKATITSIIDSGADINYVNKNRCDERKIHYKMIGWGWVQGYSGRKTRTKILEANIKMRIQGKFMRENFRVLEETGSDLLVLGDPWLTNENPDIDWKKRTVKFRAKLSTSRDERASNLRVVDSRQIEHKEAPWRRYNETTRKAERDKLKANELETIHEKKDAEKKHSEEYKKELKEIRQKLPEEIKEFADVFCAED
jgi:hypothetical protein